MSGDTSTKTRGRTVQLVRKLLVQDIRHGFFRRAEKLSAETLAARYGDLAQVPMSRTPVREALIGLERDGIVEGTANSGYCLRTPKLTELCEMYEVREELEGLAAAKLAGRGASAELLAELRACCDRRRRSADFLERSNADQRLHQLICDHCGSRTLREMISRHLIISLFFRGVPLLEEPPEAEGAENDEHDAIVAAIARGDARGARRRMARHIACARRRVESLLSQPGEDR